jgi:hypothetical protein
VKDPDQGPYRSCGARWIEDPLRVRASVTDACLFGYTGAAENSGNPLLWKATSVDAFGQVTEQYTSNGVQTISNRLPATGWLVSSASTAHADGDKLIQSMVN